MHNLNYCCCCRWCCYFVMLTDPAAHQLKTILYTEPEKRIADVPVWSCSVHPCASSKVPYKDMNKNILRHGAFRILTWMSEFYWVKCLTLLRLLSMARDLIRVLAWSQTYSCWKVLRFLYYLVRQIVLKSLNLMSAIETNQHPASNNSLTWPQKHQTLIQCKLRFRQFQFGNCLRSLKDPTNKLHFIRIWCVECFLWQHYFSVKNSILR